MTDHLSRARRALLTMNGRVCPRVTARVPHVGGAILPLDCLVRPACQGYALVLINLVAN
jgi:hypothetical protein